jgi:hypothetical protein
MISHKYKLIFIHIPKTAGGSVEEYLKRMDPDAVIGPAKKPRQFCLQHMSLKELYEDSGLSSDIIDSYFKFTVVRNSWDRAVSSYHSHAYNQPTMEAFKKDLISKGRMWPDNGYSEHEKLAHRRCQLDFIFYNDKIGVDYIVRYEHLQEDFDILCKQVGMPAGTLPYINKDAIKFKKSYQEYYDEENKRIIFEKFKKDIEYFNFEF